MKEKRQSQSDPLESLSRKLETLKMKDYIIKIEKEFDRNELYQAHTWTAIKLIILMWWLTVYSRIVPRHFHNYWYIDLLSSSGANFIQETKDIILGSPLLSYLVPYEQFKHHFFVEINSRRKKTLDRMLKLFNFSNYDTIQGDCNEVIQSIPLHAVDNYFCFIDCEGLDVKWSTLETLLSNRGDILLVFQTTEINRVFRKGKKQGISQALDNFCGDEWWKFCDDVQELLEEYMHNLECRANELRKYHNFVDYIRVKGQRHFYYDVFLICRKGPYTDAWSDLKKTLENLQDKHIRAALEVCKGNQTTLSDFIKKQSKLNNFL